MITDAQDIPRALAAAFHIASTGRPGPVLVDVTKDAQVGMMEYRGIPEDLELRGYTPATRGHSKQIREAAKLITESKRPVFYVGGGVVRAGASDELHKLAKLIGAPCRHHPERYRCVPRVRPPEPRHARHARHRSRSGCHAEVRPAHHPGCPLRRPRDRPGRLPSPPRPRSFTSTLTQPRSPRFASLTSRSLAT